MNRLIIIILFFIFNTSLFAENNIEFSIRNKIFTYLNLTFGISNENITYNITDKSKLPDFNLYDIELINPGSIELNNKMDIDVRISSFFNKNQFCNVSVRVTLTDVNSSIKKKEKLNINDKITIVFKNRNIEFIDRGTIDKITDTDIVIVKNSFNILLKCRLISNEAAEVIQ